MTRAADQLAAGQALLVAGDHVTVLAAMSPQQPDLLLAGLVAAARERGTTLTILVSDLTGTFAFLDDQGTEDVRSGRLGIVALAGAIPRGLAAYVQHYPFSLWDVDRRLADGTIGFDVFVARVCATAGDGLTLGAMVGYTPTALASDAVVGFELAPYRTSFPGTDGVALARASTVVPAPAGGARPPRRATRAAPAVAEVAARVAALIPNGATLQLGLGTIPDALADALLAKRDLGIHSGILPASIRRLLRSGAVTGAHKSRDVGLHVATGVLDGGDATEAKDWGPGVSLQPISMTHSPRLLLEHERLWAVNSAFEIDLGGCVNAEFAGSARVASAGGQTDFFRAAHASPGGGSVLALTARTNSGRTRIVARLPLEQVPTSTGGDLDYVVTEFGVAALSGATADERAERLVNVAHPDDREQLRSFRSRLVGCPATLDRK